MNLARNTIFILIALFIDGLQAAISWGIATIAAFPATTAGGTIGCVVGSQAAGQLGCWIGGVVLGILGTSGNVFLAPFTIPAGSAIGLAVNITLSATLGWAFLVPLMYAWGIKTSWQRLALGGGEMIPGINNVPFWTALTIASLWGGAARKKSRRGITSFANIFAPTSSQRSPVQSPSQTRPSANDNRPAFVSNEILADTGPKIETSPRVQLPTMNLDVRPPREINDNRPYAQAA
jgi:hypothetical protein